MIWISVLRYEPFLSVMPPSEPRQVTVMQALEVLCICEIGWGAGVTVCAPTRVQTTSNSHGVRTQVLFEGDEKSMARLVLAAAAVRDGPWHYSIRPLAIMLAIRLWTAWPVHSARLCGLDARKDWWRAGSSGSALPQVV
jgi:hypothetical protein